MDAAAAPRVRREARLPGEAGLGVAALAALLEPALQEAAGDAACVSVTLDFARPPPPGAAIAVEAWVERTTRTLVFASAEARSSGRPVGAASAVFSREAPR